jgi:Protein of unknown function (DUF3108)
MRRRFLIALALSGMAAAAAADPQPLKPFSITYNLEWRGMGAGTSTLELTTSADATYVFRSTNLARGFFRLAFPDAITQTSRFSLVDGAVTPLSYRSDDGSSKTDRDVNLNFDWKSGKATGVAEDKPVDVELKPGTQDSLSVQIALMMELAANHTPESFLLLDKRELKEYRYTREGTAVLNTPLGKIDTVIYRSERVATGTTRVTRFWLAPSLGFLPARAEQIRNGKREFALSLRSATRS